VDTIETVLAGGANIGTDGPLDLDFMETLSTAVGARAVNQAFWVMNRGATEPFALCLEGAIQTGGTDDENKDYCQIWQAEKLHAVLAEDSFVWSSVDRELLKVPNNTSEPIKVVIGSNGDRIQLSGDRTTAGLIELHPGSILASGTDLSLDITPATWVEKAADRTAIDAAAGGAYTFDSNNKVTAGAATTSAVTLTGRVEVTPSNLLASGSEISSCSLVYDGADRIAIGGGGVYAIVPMVATSGARTLLEDITLSGTVMMAPGTILLTGSVIPIGSWVELDADASAIGASTDADNKVQYANTTLTAAHTLVGRIEALEGAILDGVDTGTAGYLASASQHDRTFADEVLNFAMAPGCAVIIAVGTCASYGGIPAANGSVTGARGLISTGAYNQGACDGTYCKENTEGYWDYLLRTCKITTEQWEALMCKTICVPGCPPHPDWIVGTIAYWLNIGQPPVMDKFHRPFTFYQEYQCKHCMWQTNDTQDATITADLQDIDGNAPSSQSGRTIGNSPKLYLNKYNSTMEGCIGILGCKGRKTKADCSYRRWNGEGPWTALDLPTLTGSTTQAILARQVLTKQKGGVSWCVQTRAGCHGCTEPRFPDGWGPFFMYK
jgi:Ni,Fe-hydrogenase I small subunit